MTVTELDRQIDNTASTFIELADTHADVLRDRLLHAHKERQPDHLKSRSKLAAIVITITLLVSGLVRHLQQRLKQQWRGLNQRSSPSSPPHPQDSAPDTLPAEPLESALSSPETNEDLSFFHLSFDKS